MKKPDYSPWGAIQTAREVIPGCWFVSTASHGGYMVSPERQKAIVALFSELAANTKGCYEEDCDWAMVDLAFADDMADTAVHHAVETVKICAGWSYRRWEDVTNWLESTDAGRKCLARYEAHKASVANLWRRGGLCSINRHKHPEIPAEHWQVYLGRNGEDRTVIMPYPMQEYYSDEELVDLAWSGELVEV